MDKVIDINELFFDRQREALNYLATTSDIEQVLYGGAAGGGKSFIGCAWQIARRLKYAGTRSVIARAELNNLKETTLITFYEVCAKIGLEAEKHYRLNSQSNTITFYNGSKIILKALAYEPSDPNYDKLGSLEIMDYFIDEVAEISEKCVTILHSRCRHRLTYFCHSCAGERLDEGEYSHSEEKIVLGERIEFKYWKCSHCGEVSSGLKPRGLMSCNPNKGWVYNEFYLAKKKNELKPHRMYVPSLPVDNPFCSAAYKESLLSGDNHTKRRLYYGDWEYDDDSNKLFSTFDLEAMFRYIEPVNEQKYITADIARLGQDKSIIMVWNGLSLIDVTELSKQPITETVRVMQNKAKEYNVRNSNIVADEDGVGGGVVDLMKCKGFLNGSSPKDSRYKNLKAECYYTLATYVEQSKITIQKGNKETIIKQLETIRRHNAANDGKLMVTPKESIKAQYGFSPDMADCIMMRMYFELNKSTGKYMVGGSI